SRARNSPTGTSSEISFTAWIRVSPRRYWRETFSAWIKIWSAGIIGSAHSITRARRRLFQKGLSSAGLNYWHGKGRPDAAERSRRTSAKSTSVRAHRCSFLGPSFRADRRLVASGSDSLAERSMPSLSAPQTELPQQDASRLRKLQSLGIFSGFTAGAWLGAAEAPTKLVSIGVSPIVISLIMVIGVFLARWGLPALILGTSSIRDDVRRAPHLVIWAILAGCLWAVANTLTIFAIRDIGLSIAFPLWNSNSLLGIFWGFLFFNELRRAGWRRWIGVLGGALVMCAGAALLAIASSSQAPAAHPLRGVCAALGAGVLWGTMYIPYRKAYLTGMNPLSFVTFFTFGELGMMTALALTYTGAAGLAQELSAARAVLFWLMLGGLIWVIGDLFQQYAAKYVGISRGIPLSNTNQLWGLLWGIFVFGELHGRGASLYVQVIGGSLLMMAGVAGHASSSRKAA